MKEKHILDIKTLEDLEIEMNNARNKIPKLKKTLLWRVPLGIVISFLFPFLPMKNGRPSMSESWGYEYAVVVMLGFYILCIVYIYFDTKDKSEKRMRELKLRKHILQKPK